MMNAREFVGQFRRPSGEAGRAIADLMHAGHCEDYAATLAEVPVRSGMRLVEVGMSSGLHVPILLRAGITYHGVDHSSDMVEAARLNAPDATFFCADICDTELPACDAVLAVNTLMWWSNPWSALASIRRALCSNGIVVIGITVPFPNVLPDLGQRHYTTEELCSLLLFSGFRDVRVRVVPTRLRPYIVARGAKP